MEQKEIPSVSSTNTANDDEHQKLLQTLEAKSIDGLHYLKYDGFWCWENFIRPILSFQKNFRAKNSDIILASLPKSGTTWLKALVFTLLNRNVYSIDQTPLLTSNPHNLIHFFELDIYLNEKDPDLGHIPSPRVFSTHIPFTAIAQCIVESESKIIYICRNPLDNFTSYRHFAGEYMEDKGASLELQEAFDMFCEGIHPFGPFWDHILSYWDAHLKNPEKVLFLKYEALKHDMAFHLKKIADFMGCPISSEEECRGLIEQISNLCSLENLRNLEINKVGRWNGVLKNNSYFRKGQVGDWGNYLTPAMAERLKIIMETKFQTKGLTFNM